jgi:formylglycine-generating enzyme required for sulfatase activity
VREHAGLLLERGPGEYGFIHLTFEEYLAGMAIALRGQGDCRPIVDYLSAHVGDAAWREVSLLAVPYLGIIQQLDRVAGEVVEALAAEQPGAPGEAVVLAGQAVLDAGTTGVPPRSRRAVTEVLVATMQSAEVKPTLRREAGLILGNLGWRPDDLDAFVAVPPGPFLYGDKEEPREIPQRYWIGKYPVTNAQYARFVEDGGYQRRDLWSEEGWQDKGRREQPRYWDDARFNNPLVPVVGVTQYEAAAYCAWLTAQFHASRITFHVWQNGCLETPSLDPAALVARLPTEEEWERAARGTDGRRYPWGDAFETWRANMKESAPEEGWLYTTAICTYPQGVSPAGAWDMGGNVFEWIASKYETGSSFIVLRGGSWFNDEDWARCASRSGNYPDVFDSNYGFRAVVSLICSDC